MIHISNQRGGTACGQTLKGKDRALIMLDDRVDCEECKARRTQTSITKADVEHPQQKVLARVDVLAPIDVDISPGAFVDQASRQVQTANGLVSMVLTCYWPNVGMAPARDAQAIIDSLDTTQWSHE
jgi:hypothetical protein